MRNILSTQIIISTLLLLNAATGQTQTLGESLLSEGEQAQAPAKLEPSILGKGSSNDAPVLSAEAAGVDIKLDKTDLELKSSDINKNSGS